MADKVDRFTPEARQVITLAVSEAQKRQQDVKVEHLLLSMVIEQECMAAKILRILDIDLELVQQRLEQMLLHQPHLQGKLNLTPTVKRITELAVEEARCGKGDNISTIHLLLGLLKEDKGGANKILKELGVNLDNVRTTQVVWLS